MSVRNLLVIAGLALTPFAGAATASAVPIATLDGAGDASSLVTKVHGCHRSCEWGPALRWHRHVGFACAPVGCLPRAIHPHRCWVDGRGIRRCRW